MYVGFLGTYSLILSSEPVVISMCGGAMGILLDTLDESESESSSMFFCRFRFSTTLNRLLMSKKSTSSSILALVASFSR